jgi:hypothetical protein
LHTLDKFGFSTQQMGLSGMIVEVVTIAAQAALI